MHRTKSLLILCLLFSPLSALAQGNSNDDRWWPVQAQAKGLVKLQYTHKSNADSYRMMMQSIAGLAAKAVNEGRGDELVWVVTDSPAMEDWYTRLLADQPALQVRGLFDPWELIARYAKSGIIKGYILYRRDTTEGPAGGKHRPGMDCSVNVATSLAGLLDGVIVDESLEKAAKEHNLPLLMDVRDKTQQWCFDTYKDKFTRKMLCTQDPKKYNVRDLAIAQKAFTVYGYDEPTPAAMKWLEPPSPILGWNGGDEFKTTRMSTIWGHIQTATDWCMNLPVLMAGSEKAQLPKVKHLDPRTIDWNDKRSGVCLVSSDGDNTQWWQTSFFQSKDFWRNPNRGKIPVGWSAPLTHMVQLYPQSLELAVDTATPNDEFIEWHGGYYYPDFFAIERPDRWEILAKHARRTWAMMEKSGVQTIGFNIRWLKTPDARKAMEVFAAQTDGLLAILAFQYSPYEAGAGDVYWVKDRNGKNVPVIPARYTIWHHHNYGDRSGTPAKVARNIAEGAGAVTTRPSQPANLPRYDWAITHVWSYFRNAPGTDENAEEFPKELSTKEDAAKLGGARGYLPMLWCAQRLPQSVRTIGPEELAWRIRMKQDPKATQELIRQQQP